MKRQFVVSDETKRFTTRIMVCAMCNAHAFQDAEYGRNVRLWNKCVSKLGSSTRWRCTVCGAEKVMGDKP